MSFTTLVPAKPPCKRGGISIRLKRPTKGGGEHVEVAFYIEKPLAERLGWRPGMQALVGLGAGEHAGLVSISASAPAPYRFASTGGSGKGGVMVSLGYTEAFGRAAGLYKVPHLDATVVNGALLIPLPPALRGGQQQEEQAPGSADLEPGEEEGSCAPATDPSPADSGPRGPASPEVEAPLAGGAVSDGEDRGLLSPDPSPPQAATPETPAPPEDRAATQRRILAALKDGPMAPRVLADAVGLTVNALRHHTAALVDLGRIVETGKTVNKRISLAAPRLQRAEPAPNATPLAGQPVKPLPGFRIGQDNGNAGRAAATKAPPPTAPQPEDERIRKLFDPEKGVGAGQVAAALGWPLPRVTRRLKDLGLVRAG